jgi:type VI protein secretion system component VasF
MIRRAVMALWFLLAPAVAFALSQPPAAQDQFVPIDQLPPSEQLPAAPLVIAAYAIFLVLMVGYVWSIGRRLQRVEKDMQQLQRHPPAGGAAR